MALAIANDGPEDILVYLEPFGLPPGVRLTCTPRTLRVQAKSSSQFSISVIVDTVVPPGAQSDSTFVLHACRWTRDMETTEAFGGWVITIRPRQRSTVSITATGQPPNIVITGILPGGMANDRVWVRLTPGRDQPIVWKLAPVLASGAFTTTIGPVPTDAATVQVEAHFDGNDLLASSAVGPVTVPTAGAAGRAAGDRCRGRYADWWRRRWRRRGRLDRSDDRWGRIMPRPVRSSAGSPWRRGALSRLHRRAPRRRADAERRHRWQRRVPSGGAPRGPRAGRSRGPSPQQPGRAAGVVPTGRSLPGNDRRPRGATGRDASGHASAAASERPALAEPVDVGDEGEVVLPGLPAFAGAPDESIAGGGNRIAVASGTTVWVWTI